MNRLKRSVGIFLYVLFIGLMTGLGENYGMHLRKIGSATFNNYPVFVFLTIFPIIIGILLGLPRFINELKKEGIWKWDWVKFLAAGLPTLYISLFYALAYSPISRYIYLDMHVFLASSKIMVYLAGMAFGYLLLSTPYKDTDSSQD